MYFRNGLQIYVHFRDYKHRKQIKLSSMNYKALKTTLLIVLPCITILSCEEKDISNAKYMRAMEDTVFATYPTVNRVSIEVKSNDELVVTIGDKELYNSDDDKMQTTANEIGNMAIHIFGRNTLEKGDAVFVANETSIDVNENEKKTFDMHLAHE